MLPGSTAVVADAEGNKVAEVRYKAWGEDRYTFGTTPTTYRYTGQRQEAALGLYFYNARWYDPFLGRFVQADTIVPEPENPQSLNRFAYVQNNPLRFTDPTGHYEFETDPNDPYGIPAAPGIMPARRSTIPYAYTTKERRALIHRYGESLKKQTEMDSLERFAQLVDYAAGLYDPQSETDDFVRDLSAVILGYEGPDWKIHTIGYDDGREESRYWLGEDAFDNRGSWADWYFDYEPNNQMFHFWYYVAVEYFEGHIVATAGNICHESPLTIPPCGGGGVSIQDFLLAEAAMKLGHRLWIYAHQNQFPHYLSFPPFLNFIWRPIAPGEVGNWIRHNLGQNP